LPTKEKDCPKWIPVSNNFNFFYLITFPVGKCDGLLSIKFASNPDTSTDVVKGSFDPVWNDKIDLPVRTPTMADVINVQVRDWDPVIFSLALFQFTFANIGRI
jgi:hypothetical protein